MLGNGVLGYLLFIRYTSQYDSAMDLWEREKASPKKAYRLLGQLPENKVNVAELEQILKEIFTENPDVLKSPVAGIATDVRRLIRIYDYLKWGKK